MVYNQFLKAEFPQATAIVDFLEERGYLSIPVDEFWVTAIDIIATNA